MKNKKIELRLRSDTCVASGLGAFGGVDTDIAVDEFGLPVIPAKRLKGLLREAGLDIASLLPEWADTFYRLYGKPGASDSGGLILSSGELVDADALKKEIKNRDYTPAQVTEIFTSLRTGTAMTGEGLIRKTDDNTLRVTRVAESGLTFSFDALFPDDCAEFLAKCCQAVRGIGSGRTRGFGEVECKLDLAGADGPAGAAGGEFKLNELNGSKFVHYTLTLASPVIVSLLNGGSGGTEDYIPGSLLLGAFAAAWRKTPGRACPAPHKDPEFRRLFLDGGVKFLAAYPQKKDGGPILYPAARSIRRSKDDASRAIDASVAAAPDEYAKTLGGFAAADGEDQLMHLGGVKKSVFAHHARPADKAAGHATKDASQAAGSFYRYEALAAGQVFMGTIVGSESDLEIIRELAPATIRLGGSRTAQYGGADFSWFQYPRLQNRMITIEDGDLFRVTLRSPLILTDAFGGVRPDPALIPGALGLRGAVVRKMFCSAAWVGGYNSKWLLPRTQETALAGGGVIVFRQESGGKEIIPAEAFIGLRTGEGFGHIAVEKLPAGGDLRIQRAGQAAAEIRGGGGLNKLEKKIKLLNIPAHIQRQVNRAEKTRITNNSQLGRLQTYLSTTHSFAELAGMLSAGNWKQQDDREKIQIFCVGEKTGDAAELARKLRQKAEKVVLSSPDLLANEEEGERKLFHWYKRYLLLRIRRDRKETAV
ncbi:MAG: hypothetical protein LBH21_04905 [Gracilibacteraceae bacterium]|jgi:CRISPR-associated protein Csx10|nr:hypothetical protein [Gracilibacteraceae bacterium]